MKRRVKTRAFAAGWLVAGITAWAGQALAGEPSAPAHTRVAVSDQTIDCGAQSFTVTGTGWTPDRTVQILFVGERIDTVSIDSQGRFSITATAPEAPLGKHTLRAIQGGHEATATASCVAEEVGPRAGAVAFGGQDITVGVLILLGLLIATGATLTFGRRPS